MAGTTLARALERRLPAGHRVVPASEESCTTFNPMLAEGVGASVFPERVVAPTRQMLRRSRFVMARVARKLGARIEQRPTRRFSRVSRASRCRRPGRWCAT